MEMEVKTTFFTRFDETVAQTLRGQVKNNAKSQLNLVSELELFRWTALRESREESAEDFDKKFPKPHTRVLADDPNKLFEDEDAATAIKQIFSYLWDNKDVFDEFSNQFLVNYCEEMMIEDPFKVD